MPDLPPVDPERPRGRRPLTTTEDDARREAHYENHYQSGRASGVLALVDTNYPNRRSAAQATDQFLLAGFECTPPVWDDRSPTRPWLVQLSIPDDLADGFDAAPEARRIIERTVRPVDGEVDPNIPERRVVARRSHTTRPGGPPFVGRLPHGVMDAYERSLLPSEANGDVPMFDHDA